MRFLLNLIWLVVAGVWLALGYVLGGLLWAITIIGLPYAKASFRIALYALWPFGRTVIRSPSAGRGSMLGNVLWFIFPGWILALAHIVTAFFQAITVVGLPLAYANVKMVPVALLPFGKMIVSNNDITATMREHMVSGLPDDPTKAT
jgi:uncharacterized membrane protein YccF (DUF307 family)